MIFIAAAGWQIGEALSPDALALALGVIFGMMAGIPAALIAGAGANKRVDVYHHLPATETSQTPAAAISAHVAPNRAQIAPIVQPGVIVLPVATRGKLLEVVE